MRHFLNGIEISPRNREGIGVVSDFSGNPDILSLNVDSLILPREANELIRNHINNVGLFEGIPYSVETGGVTLEYFIDLSDGLKVRDHEVEVNLKRRNGLDIFRERANGTSFDLMLKNGVVYETSNAPFFVIKDNQGELIISLSITTYIMTREIIQAGADVQEAGQNLITVSAPIPGLGVGVPPVITTSFNVAGIISASILLLFKLAFFILLAIALVELAKQLFAVLFPAKKFLKATYFTEILEKSCAYLGMEFQSTLLDDAPHFALLPVPLVPERESAFATTLFSTFETITFSTGLPGSSDSVSTFGQFLDALETMFNARIIVRNGVVQLERRDWLESQTINVIEPALSLQSDRDNEYQYNAVDIWKRYYLHYALDYSDVHTLDGITYDKHDAEFSTEPDFSVTNQDLLTIKGLNDVNIPFSLGARKNELNAIEKIAKALFTLIDTVSNIFGDGTNYASQIDARKDALQISQLYFSQTKVLYGQSGLIEAGELIQESNYFDNISAKALWDKYHYINEIQENDWKIFENTRIRLSHSEFVTLQSNNYAEINGILSEILRIEWIDDESYAEITYRQRNDWANNKVITQTINE